MIVIPNLYLIFGKVYIVLWALDWISAPSDGWLVGAYFSDLRRLVAVMCPLLEG
jgi:hypothetical protein